MVWLHTQFAFAVSTFALYTVFSHFLRKFLQKVQRTSFTYV